jgi:hypothetical protein
MNGEPIQHRGMLSVLVATLAIAANTGGSHAQTADVSCHGAQQPKRVAELLFGRGTANRRGVNETAWEHFVAQELTPRFPEGLTITAAVGQWRDPATGTIGREQSERVEIVLPGKADEDARLDAIVKAYEREFHQRSVVVIVRPACVSF